MASKRELKKPDELVKQAESLPLEKRARSRNNGCAGRDGKKSQAQNTWHPQPRDPAHPPAKAGKNARKP